MSQRLHSVTHLEFNQLHYPQNTKRSWWRWKRFSVMDVSRYCTQWVNPPRAEQGDLFIVTADGPQAIDELYPRLTDASFLGLRKHALRIHPRFGLFAPDNPRCSICQKFSELSGRARGTISLPSPLHGEWLSRGIRWFPSSMLVFMNSVLWLFLLIAWSVGIPLMAVGQAVYDQTSIQKSFIEAMHFSLRSAPYFATCLVAYLWIMDNFFPERVLDVTFEARFPCAIQPHIKELLAVLQNQFEEVLLICEISRWRKAMPYRPSRLQNAGFPAEVAGSPFLVIVRKGTNWWLAATVVNDQISTTKGPAVAKL